MLDYLKSFLGLLWELTINELEEGLGDKRLNLFETVALQKMYNSFEPGIYSFVFDAGFGEQGNISQKLRVRTRLFITLWRPSEAVINLLNLVDVETVIPSLNEVQHKLYFVRALAYLCGMDLEVAVTNHLAQLHS